MACVETKILIGYCSVKARKQLKPVQLKPESKADETSERNAEAGK